MAAKTASYAETEWSGFNAGLKLLWLLVLCSAAANPALASTVHKWVDSKGVTHYSDQAPPMAASEVSKLSLRDTEETEPDTPGSASHYYSIANQWQRMQREQQLRQQRELQREQMRLEHQAQNPQPTRASASDDDRRYVVVYPRRHRKPHRRHYPHNVKPMKPAYPGSGLGAFPSIP